MERLVKKESQFLCENGDKCFGISVTNEAVREDTETLVDPESRHGWLSVMIVLVGSQQTLEHLSHTAMGQMETFCALFKY